MATSWGMTCSYLVDLFWGGRIKWPSICPTIVRQWQTLSYFDRMQDRIVHFVCQNSDITEEDFRKLMMQTGEMVMDVGTVLDGEKAVKYGLINQLGSLSDAIACLYEIIDWR